MKSRGWKYKVKVICSRLEEVRLLVVHWWTWTLMGACDQARKARFHNWFRVSSSTPTSDWLPWTCSEWLILFLMGGWRLRHSGTCPKVDAVMFRLNSFVLGRVWAFWVLMVHDDTMKSLSVMATVATPPQQPGDSSRSITGSRKITLDMDSVIAKISVTFGKSVHTRPPNSPAKPLVRIYQFRLFVS